MSIATAKDLQQYVTTRLSLVQQTLADHVDRAATDLPQGGHDYAQLWRSVGTQTQHGKYVRPALTLAAYWGLGGDDDAVVPVAAAMEMLHTAMLIHDDILDHDEVRRGVLNVAGTRRGELEGTPLLPDQVESQVLAAALLGGDLALSSAYDLISRTSLPAHHRIACLDLVTRAVRATIAGELLDMYADLMPPGDVESLHVAELKTATYSFVVPLLAGAQLAGADPTMVTHLERIGLALGLSFQLIDDDLGVFGDPDETGKSVLSDLRAGKRTQLIKEAYSTATAAQRADLDTWIGNPRLDIDAAAGVRAILEDTGARARVQSTARRYARQAERIALERVPSPLSGYLVDMVERLSGRRA